MASLGINLDDYVSITSYTHHPFYSTFAVEVQDNWRFPQSLQPAYGRDDARNRQRC